MERRAVKTLVNAYWSREGWREPPAAPPEDELAHAIDVGDECSFRLSGAANRAHDRRGGAPKLTFGLVTVDEGDPWPTKATMQNAGHKIVELDGTVRRVLIRRQQTSTAPGLIARLPERAQR